VANVLQDTLRLLTLWFAHGGDEHEAIIHSEVAAGLESASPDTWLGVVPQLIARVHTRLPRVNKLLHQLLARVGREHPQAVRYYKHVLRVICTQCNMI
jgi:serine/threonine-protein kinase mTOR